MISVTELKDQFKNVKLTKPKELLKRLSHSADAPLNVIVHTPSGHSCSETVVGYGSELGSNTLILHDTSSDTMSFIDLSSDLTFNLKDANSHFQALTGQKVFFPSVVSDGISINFDIEDYAQQMSVLFKSEYNLVLPIKGDWQDASTDVQKTRLKDLMDEVKTVIKTLSSDNDSLNALSLIESIHIGNTPEKAFMLKQRSAKIVIGIDFAQPLPGYLRDLVDRGFNDAL